MFGEDPFWPIGTATGIFGGLLLASLLGFIVTPDGSRLHRLAGGGIVIAMLSIPVGFGTAALLDL